jgi:hypothetical protein
MPIGHAKCKNEMCVALDTVEGFLILSKSHHATSHRFPNRQQWPVDSVFKYGVYNERQPGVLQQEGLQSGAQQPLLLSSSCYPL